MRGRIITYPLFIIIEEYILYNIEIFIKQKRKNENALFVK